MRFPITLRGYQANGRLFEKEEMWGDRHGWGGESLPEWSPG